MSEIKLKKILACSSEDNAFKAENLIKRNGKWVCDKNTNETKHSVTILLEKASKIRQVNVENENSAFIEIVVGSESTKEDDEFKSLLAATSFMNPTESKTQTNCNRLRIFTNETLLDKEAAEQQYEVVKIFCSQPFNKDTQFGIGSVQFFDGIVNDDIKEAAKLQTGVFSLKKNLSESTSKKEEITATKTLVTPSVSKKEEKQEMKDDEDEKQEEKESAYEKWKKKNGGGTAVVASKKESDDDNDDGLTTKKKQENDAKSSPAKNDKAAAATGRSNDPRSILRGVIFALSGFQNPLRAEIRDKGMKLGAKYRPDWTDDCTHLVTAFSNTPKVKQVKNAKKGKIVTKDWIIECEKQGKMLDANDFEVESDSDSSDDDGSKPRRAAKVAVAKISKLKKRDSLLDSDEDEEEAENSDDRDFVVGSSEEDDVGVSESSESSESESEASFTDSDDDDGRKSKKKKKSSKRSKTSKKTKQVKKLKKASPSPKKSDSDDSDDDLAKYKMKREKELKKKKAKRESETTAAAKTSKDDDEDDDDKPKTKKTIEKTKKKEIAYGDDDSDQAARRTEDKENKGEIKKKPAELNKTVSTSSNKTIENSDMEEGGDGDNDEWKLPSFFENKTFFIYNDYDFKKRKILSRVIVAYGGSVSEYMSDEVDFVITEKKWNKEFDEGLKENSKLKFVESAWLNVCNRRKKLLSYEPFEIVPEE